MPVLLNFLVRLLLVAAGLVFAASLALVATFMLALWGAGALWAKLTGKPVVPFAARVAPFGGFYRWQRETMRSPAGPGRRAPRPIVVDVTDVEPKTPANLR